MPDDPATDPKLARARQALQDDEIRISVEDTPAGMKVGYTGADNPFDITPEQFEAFRNALDEYEDVLVALHTAAEEHDGIERLWHAGQAIIDHYAANGYDAPEYTLLADLATFLDADETWFRNAVCLADLFDDPDALPEADSEDAIRRAGKTCRQTGEAEAVRAELRD